VQIRLPFHDYLAIITETSSTSAILYDGQAMAASLWTEMGGSERWGYSYAAFSITPDFHVVTTVNTGAKFGAYAYGHSILDTSSGAYGYTVAYQRKSR